MTDRSRAIEMVTTLISAPTCYQGLKDLGQTWLDAVGTEQEAELTKQLLKAVEEDIEPIDKVIELFGSPRGEEIFGKEQAQALLKKGLEVKAAGGKYCFCAACQACLVILENKECFEE